MTYSYIGYNVATGHRPIIGGYTNPKQVEARNLLMGINEQGPPRSSCSDFHGHACADDGMRRLPRQFYFRNRLGKGRMCPFFLLGEDWSVTGKSRPLSLRKHLPFVPNFGRHCFCLFLDCEAHFRRRSTRITIEYLNELLGACLRRRGSEQARTLPLQLTKRIHARCVAASDDMLTEIGYWP